jgi:hypothetical protein
MLGRPVSIVVSIVVPSLLVGLACALGRREWKQYRAAAEIGSDLFVYTRGRLIRRMTGVALLVALAVTLALFGALPPRTPAGASVYLGVMLGEVVLLIVLPIVDLVETARTARPGKGIRAREGAPPRTRTRPRPPR